MQRPMAVHNAENYEIFTPPQDSGYIMEEEAERMEEPAVKVKGCKISSFKHGTAIAIMNP